MLGFDSKIMPVFHGVGWKDWFSRCKKLIGVLCWWLSVGADDSVPHVQ